jgi:hypothetical protein
MAGRLKPPGHGTLDFPNSEDVRIEGWRGCRLLKRESVAACRCSGRRTPRASALSLARRIFQTHSDPSPPDYRRGLCTYRPRRQARVQIHGRLALPPASTFPSATSAGVAAAQLLLPVIHEIEARCGLDPLRAQDRQQAVVMIAPGHLSVS